MDSLYRRERSLGRVQPLLGSSQRGCTTSAHTQGAMARMGTESWSWHIPWRSPKHFTPAPEGQKSRPSWNGCKTTILGEGC